MGRVHELAAADVDPDVVERVEEDQVSRLELIARHADSELVLRSGVVRERDPELRVDVGDEPGAIETLWALAAPEVGHAEVVQGDRRGLRMSGRQHDRRRIGRRGRRVGDSVGHGRRRVGHHRRYLRRGHGRRRRGDHRRRDGRGRRGRGRGRLRRSGGGFGGSRALGGLTAERGFFGCETATRLGSELRLAARFLGAHRRKLRLHRREEAATLREHRSDLHLLVRELLHGRGATVFALLQCSSRRSKLVAHLRRLLRELSIRRRNRPCRLQPIDQVTEARAAEDDVDRGRLVALVDRHEP